jgi:phospholipid/cholesterol/gamma-HCH transport system ATP-binding protein
MEKIIEVMDLHKSFPGKDVLTGINFHVNKGENLVIIGRSGEGKSITLKCITGLIEPDQGTVKVLDKDVSELDEEGLKVLRCKMGYLFQGGALYDSMSVRENLAFPLKRVLGIRDDQELEKRSTEVLEAVDLADTMDKMPSELSGGMRKRMALARTLIVQPEIILYDEPTTGLDTMTSLEISKLILKMQQQYQTTSIVVTHDMQCAKTIADRIVVISEGKCICSGTYEELEKCDDDFVRSFFN